MACCHQRLSKISNVSEDMADIRWTNFESKRAFEKKKKDGKQEMDGNH